MATIKSFTSLEQSKELAEILPLESADMCYINGDIGKISIEGWKNNVHDEDDVPCWSLAALLKVLPDDCGIDKEDGKYVATYLISNECGAYTSDNPIDACVEMVLKLKENKLI